MAKDIPSSETWIARTKEESANAVENRITDLRMFEADHAREIVRRGFKSDAAAESLKGSLP